VLMATAADDPESRKRLFALLQGLQQLGWVEGRKLRVDIRWAAGNVDDTRKYAAELTADFHVCLTCGAIPIVTCMIEGIRYAVFNVDTFDDVDRSEFVETATNFEGETTENRLARRRRNWTPENIRNGGAKLR
jgi:hypothetical protein